MPLFEGQALAPFRQIYVSFHSPVVEVAKNIHVNSILNVLLVAYSRIKT
jgi:hypothetical protein